MSEISENKKAYRLPPMLYSKTQNLISEFEKNSGDKLITYWHSWSGNVSQSDVVALNHLFKRIGRLDRVKIFIKSDGGSIEAALRIIHLVRQYVDSIDAILLSDCASAATIIALGADRIFMSPLAYLTPIDASLSHKLAPIDTISNDRASVSNDELQRIIRLWRQNSKDHHEHPFSEIFKYIHPLVIGASDRSISLSTMICNEVMSYHIADKDRRENISNILNSNYPSHSYPITMREASKIGLSVFPLQESEVEILSNLDLHYAEMAQKAVTDFDEFGHHNNEIINIIESGGAQIFYQNDKDWHYLKEERRWRSTNDMSGWRLAEMFGGELNVRPLHIR